MYSEEYIFSFQLQNSVCLVQIYIGSELCVVVKSLEKLHFWSFCHWIIAFKDNFCKRPLPEFSYNLKKVFALPSM